MIALGEALEDHHSLKTLHLGKIIREIEYVISNDM